MKNSLVKRLAPIVAAGVVSLATLAGCELPPTTGTITIDFPQGPYSFTITVHAKNTADNSKTDEVINPGQKSSYPFELDPGNYNINGGGYGIVGPGGPSSFSNHDSNIENISVNAGGNYTVELVLH